MMPHEKYAATKSTVSQFVTVNNSQMHYLEQGEGDPILFIHGMPTSSFLWRNIIPQVASCGRCIAPDLIGMGRSDKPDIEYRVFDHIKYLEGFIEELNLKNITLVLHGWGSVVGFDYASRHPGNIKAIAFFESHVRPITDWNLLSLPVQQFASLLKRPGASYRAIVQQNYLIKKLLPSGVVRELSIDEQQEYESPFPDAESRKPLWQYVMDFPLGNGPDDVVKLITDYSEWLQHSSMPKLMLYAVPGFITTMETVQWAMKHVDNLSVVCLEDVMHFAQESTPDLFSKELTSWLQLIDKF